MLHILWLIIKFILIVLGILLGLVLLGIILLLFCPLRYRASVYKEEGLPLKETHLQGGVSWLFHGISLSVCYEDGNLSREFRILGIPFASFQKLFSRFKKKGGKKKPKQTVTMEDIEPLEDGMEEAWTAEDGTEDSLEEPPKKQETLFQEKESRQTHTEDGDGKKEIPVSSLGIWDRLKQNLLLPVRIWKALTRAVGVFFGKIKKTAYTIQLVYARIEWWKAFVSHERTQEAIELVLTDAKALVRHVLPTKTEGRVTFGCEDPSVTGSILAFLGMSIPFHKNCIAVTPLFDSENYLEGFVRIRGRIYGWIFLKTAAEIYFNKNVKYVISRWRHKEV